MRAFRGLFFFFLSLYALPTFASGFLNGRSSFSYAEATHRLVGCESRLSNSPDLQNISVTDPVRDSIAIAKLLNLKINSTQFSVFTRMAQAAFEISLANGGNVSISKGVTDGQVDPRILIRIDLKPEELDGSYRLRYSSSQEELGSQILIPRIEIRIEPERIVIFQARARAVKIGHTLLATEETSHGNALIVAYPGSETPVIDSGIVPSRMVFNSETLFGRHCLEIAKVAGLNMSSNGLVYMRTLDGYYIFSGDGWVPSMSTESSSRRVGAR